MISENAKLLSHPAANGAMSDAETEAPSLLQ